MKDLVMTSERRSGIDINEHDENEYEVDKVDKVTSMIYMENTIDRYTELQRIKYAEDRDREIDIAMKNCEAKLRVWGIEPEILRIKQK